MAEKEAGPQMKFDFFLGGEGVEEGGQHPGYIYIITFLCDTRGLSKDSNRLMSHFVNSRVIL